MTASGVHRAVGRVGGGATALAVLTAPEETPRTEFPRYFQGIFGRVRDAHGEAFIRARESLGYVPMPEEFKPYYLYGVLGHAQPSYMLVPMMHLAVADALGGVTADDLTFLPWSILSMEQTAILDDVIDGTPLRSGRKTYVHRFGEPSAAAMISYLFSLVVGRSAAISGALVPVIADYFSTLSSLMTWEFHSRYPAATIPAGERWLRHRYDACISVIHLTFNGALALRGMPFMPAEPCIRAGEIMQDVDDLVNFLDRREKDGENDDIKMGIMVHPLLAALRADPAAAPALEALWRPYRRIARDSLDSFWAEHALCGDTTAAEYEVVARLVYEHGVPATVDKLIDDARVCVDTTPEHLRPCMRDIIDSFLDRARRLDALPAASKLALAQPFSR